MTKLKHEIYMARLNIILWRWGIAQRREEKWKELFAELKVKYNKEFDKGSN